MSEQELSHRLRELFRQAAGLARLADRALTELDLTARREAELVTQVADAKAHLALKEDMVAILERIQQETQAHTIGRYTKMLTTLVNDVIDPEKEIAIDLTIERGQPALSIWSYLRGFPEYRSSVFENSGAITNVICAGLRIISVAKAGGRRLLVLDEPDCWMSEQMAPAFYDVLRDLCHRLNYQIVVISHKPQSVFGECRSVQLLKGEPDTVRIAPKRRRGRAAATKDAVGETSEETGGTEASGSEKSGDKIVEIRTAIVGASKGGTSWSDIPEDRPGIRSLRIRNLATLKDVEIHLDPYMTVITGQPDTGKSRITRALRSALYGETEDSDIRYETDRMSVDMDFEAGVRLAFSRQPGRNPVNLWSLIDREGAPLHYEGSVCSTGGRELPPWIGPMLGIVRTEGLDMQISHQKRPVFLLDQPATRQAVVLSIGQEIQYLRGMQIRYRDDLKAWNKSASAGEVEIAELRHKLEQTSKAEALFESSEEMKAGINEIGSSLQQTGGMADMASRLRATLRSMTTYSGALNAMRELPEPPQVPDLTAIGRTATDLAVRRREYSKIGARLAILQELPVPPRLPDGRMAELAKELTRSHTVFTGSRYISDVLKKLPEPPDRNGALQSGLQRGQEVVQTSGRLQTTEKSRNAAVQAVARTEADYRRSAAVYADLVEQAGGECPLCHSPMDPEEPAHRHAAQPSGTGTAERTVEKMPAGSVEHDNLQERPAAKTTGPQPQLQSGPAKPAFRQMTRMVPSKPEQATRQDMRTASPEVRQSMPADARPSVRPVQVTATSSASPPPAFRRFAPQRPQQTRPEPAIQTVQEDPSP